ncbi:MAG: hypothetical protein QGH94_04165 [Phycisphaerae bacterium]|nr:hypothetical protein [Phycisphaerae bacterium]MDP7287169.1 hypothetical protein [Phycisphaerae bacterium]
MTNTATDANTRPDPGRVKSPLWYSILVCLGSAGVGGFFGAVHEIWGLVFGAVGGVGVAVFWLRCVSTLRRSPIVRIVGGTVLGVLAGVLDTCWLHMTAWGLGYETLSSGELPVDLALALLVGCYYGVIAGGLYGLGCMIVLQLCLAIKRKGRPDG